LTSKEAALAGLRQSLRSSISIGITAGIAPRSSAASPIQYLRVGRKIQHTILCQFDKCRGCFDLALRPLVIKKLEERWNGGNNRKGVLGCRASLDHTVGSRCGAPFSDSLTSAEAAAAIVSSSPWARSLTSNGIAGPISARSSSVHYHYCLYESISYDSPISANLASEDVVAP
jgi:hypothetical protein